MSNVETIKVVPARYPLRTVGAVVALFILAVVIQSVAFNPRWEWAVFARWFFDPVILAGVGQTLLLTLIGTALSVVIGGLLGRSQTKSEIIRNNIDRAKPNGSIIHQHGKYFKDGNSSDQHKCEKKTFCLFGI